MPVPAIAGQQLHSHIPAAVSALRPVARPSSTQHLRLAICLPARNPDELTNLVAAISDPASPDYRKYLTPAQFTARFGPTESDYQAVADFAKANGLTVTTTHSNRLILDVDGTIADIERAFHLTLRTYQHPLEARTFFAPDTEPSLDLAVAVLHISGLDNYSLPHPNHKIRPLDTTAKATPNAGTAPGGTYAGGDFRAAYVPGTSLTGSGQAVALLQFDGYYASDIAAYKTQFGLPDVPLINVAVNGGVSTPGAGNVEVCLDIEMALSMAPGLAAIYVYMAPNPSPWVDILSKIANDNLAKQIGCSWGGGSAPLASVSEPIFQQMATQGQSFFNATGDSDAFTGTIPFPSDSPSITEVGGTTLTTTGPGGSYLSETVWNKGSSVGSSGGSSTSYPIPTWQQGISMTANLGSTTKRNLPDVALIAENVYVRYNNGGAETVGGTSCAAPLWAGLTALINQQAVANGRATVGFINPAVYAIGKGAYYTSNFHDTIVGNNYPTSTATRYPAVVGYDLCTGWGTPAGVNLINILAGTPTNLAATPGANMVNLTWNAPFGAAASNVKRSLTSSGPYVILATTTATSYLDTAVTDGTTYYYVISAITGGVESADSAAVSIIPNMVASTTTLASSPATSGSYGTSVIFTATVAGTTPTGTVTFTDGSATLGAGTLNGSGQATYTIRTLALGLHQISASYAGDFTFKPSTSTALGYTVNQKSVSITGAAAASKVYDGTTTVVLSGGTVSGVVSGETVTVVAGTGTFADANAGTNKTVTTTGYALDGANAGNYVLSGQPAVTGTITPRPVQLAGTRAYDGTSVAAAGVLSVTNNLDGGSLTLTGNAGLAGRNVGSQTITNSVTPVRVASASGAVGSSSASSFTVTLTAVPSAGNTLIAVIATRSSSAGALTGIANSGTALIWTRAVQSTPSTSTTTEIWYAPVLSGAGTSLTVNLSGSMYAAAVVGEYSGILTPGPVDVAASNSNASNSLTASTGTTATTTQANEVAIAGMGLMSSSYTMGSITNAFTSVASVVSGGKRSSNAKVYFLEKILTVTGTQSAGGTVSTSSQWSGAIVTFKAAATSTLVLGGSAPDNE